MLAPFRIVVALTLLAPVGAAAGTTRGPAAVGPGAGAAEPLEAGPVAALPLRGRTVAQALAALQKQGLELVYSSALVKPSMLVEREPRARDLAGIAREILAPHGLEIVAGPKGRLVIVPLPESQPEILAMATTIERLEVTTKRRESVHGEPIGTLEVELLDPERDVPHFGNDVFRAAGLVGSTTTTETSSRVAVRGSRSDDVLVVLDGLELLAPYHLPEFDFALGIVSDDALEHVEVIADPFPAEYGDRSGGVLDMRSRTPSGPFGFSVTLGSLLGEISTSGTFDDGRGSFLGAARAGNYRLALEAAGRSENPRFWDGFGKIDYRLTPRQVLQLRMLEAQDNFALAGDALDGGAYESRWRSSYVWVTHQANLGSSALAESVLWTGRLHRKRTAREATDGGTRFDLDDLREFEITGFKTTWRFAPAASDWSFDTGIDQREFHAEIAYRADRADRPGGSPGGNGNGGVTSFERAYDFDQFAGFASARWRGERGLSLEGGLRYDHIGLTDEAHVSPRLHLSQSVGASGLLRAGLGWYYQSQRPYELQVEDGETEVWDAERSEQRLISYEQRFTNGQTLRFGVFQRLVGNPRPRSESLFDTAALYPELAGGRVRIEPVRSHSEGVEIDWRGTPAQRLAWSAHYSLSRVVDLVGGRWIPRATDQTHALELVARYDLGHGWDIAGVWSYHTGWPTTHVGAVVVGEGDPVQLESTLGPVRGERFPDYHRLDLRLGRTWELRRGRLGASIDLQNLYDRSNPRGYEHFTLGLDADGEPTVRRDAVSWGGFAPSFSVRWGF